jgi:Rod binding domain-containing protein
MNVATHSLNMPTALSRRAALEKHARALVSQTFFGTLLKQMRHSPFRSELLDGGRGGQAFGSLYDQHLAERMSRGAGDKLVRAIVRKLEANRAYAKQAPLLGKGGQTPPLHDAPAR